MNIGGYLYHISNHAFLSRSLLSSSHDHIGVLYMQGLIHSVVGGFNGTVFAYGQTSSGKTHTMRGTSEDPGLIPKAVREVFNRITASPGREFLLRVAYLELYNEEFRDLLAPNSNHKLQLHEDPARGIFVAGLHEELVTSPEQVHLQTLMFVITVG